MENFITILKGIGIIVSNDASRAELQSYFYNLDLVAQDEIIDKLSLDYEHNLDLLSIFCAIRTNKIYNIGV